LTTREGPQLQPVFRTSTSWYGRFAQSSWRQHNAPPVQRWPHSRHM